MKRRAILSLLLSVITICLVVSPVLAISNPTSISITKTIAFQDVLVTGDILFTAEYNIVYGSAPTESVAEAFIFQLIDTDGVTELGRVLAYPYVNGGYGKGVVSFYFAVKPGTDAYIIRVIGNPAVFTTPYTSSDFVLPSSTYSGSSGNVSTDIYNTVMVYAVDLDPVYQLDLLSSLIIAGMGTPPTLSGVGQIYFQNAIPNLQNMSPQLFDIQQFAPTSTTDSYNTTQADAYKNRFVGTWVGSSTTAFGNLLGTDMQVAMGVFIMIICILWAVAAVGLTGSAQASFLPMVSTLLGGVLLGWVSMAVMSVIVFLCALYIGVIIIFKGVQA